MSVKDNALARLRDTIPEVTPNEARTLFDGGAVLIDIRPPAETALGMPVGAAVLTRDRLELNIEDHAPDPQSCVLLLCNSGVRSLFAADNLRQVGYTDVRSVAGGYQRWKSEKLPIEVPTSLNATERQRYARHILLPEVGLAGQQKLLDSHVLIVGAGGLGSPAAMYLAAAGVGHLTLIDHDVVDCSNLQRQILYTDASTGLPKTEVARSTLKALNPGIRVNAVNDRLDRTNVEDLFTGHDVIVDGSDNFPTRYLVNDACVKLGLPNVHGSVFRFEGQAAVFWPAGPDEKGPCYRCLYPQPPPPELAPTCGEAGVMGVLPGVVGLLQATETIKLLLGLGDLLTSRILHYDALQARFTDHNVSRDPNCAVCGDNREFPGYQDYDSLCSA
jgi:molybdopterin/thiamine biosynthesis adenylyltransferase/rhodanese-related sulfurtransferase